jgi:putative membrane protein
VTTTTLVGLLAQTEVAPPVIRTHWHPETFVESLISTLAFGGLGVVLLFVGFKLFERLTPRLDVEKELAEKNMAVGVVVAAMFVALGLIIAHTISG